MKQRGIQHFKLTIMGSEEINAYHVFFWRCKDSYMNSCSIQSFSTKSKSHSINRDSFHFNESVFLLQL